VRGVGAVRVDRGVSLLYRQGGRWPMVYGRGMASLMVVKRPAL
jgi:hypothetical protein